jgi:homoserine kinase
VSQPFDHVRAVAPGGIGNLGPGLDILGCAVTGPGDAVEAWWCEEPGVHLVDPGHPDLPADAERHSSGIAAMAVLARAPEAPRRGIVLRVEKRLPLAGGQGGSASSAVAGAAAANALLGAPLGRDKLLAAALEAESAVAGRHLDNIAPILMGGIVLVRSMDPLDLVELPVPEALRIVLVHPAQRLRTADARAVLPPVVDRATALAQAAQVAAMVAALASGDLALFGRAIDDRIAEPVRAPLMPGFAEAKRAALEAGALGCSISGAGPTAFAACDDDDRAVEVAEAMCAAYRALGIACTARVEQVDRRGVRIERSHATIEQAGGRR